MTKNIPEISPALREWTEKVALDHGKVVDRVYAALMNIKLYADLDSPTKLDIRNSVAWSAKLWFGTLLSGTAPSAEGLEAFREYGRRRVYQGLPLDALLRAFRLGSRELWCFYIDPDEKSDELRDELLFRISPFLMEFFDVLAQIISQTYLDEQYKQARWRESLRYQLHSIIFYYPEDTEGFAKTAAALRLDGTIPRIALAIDVHSIDSNSPTFKSELDRIVVAIARRLKLPVDTLFDIWYGGKLLLWIPARLGDLIGMSDLQVGKQIAALAETSPEIKAIGVGLMGEGAAGWAMSAEEASRALSLGRAQGGEESVWLYSKIVLEESVRCTKNALRYLVSLVEQLASEPELLETLKTYFDQLQRRKVTASVLGIHPNTLNYRLERIENILGARLDDASWISKLDIAIKLHGSAR
ncbi:PucR family transcriptional regulator [Paraburkholderia phenazinium]|jgi:carbohydrate diacid regulator|uniref:Transcriptional regulator, CdaR family n=1 Tax=Paraburkholderia phenazinium TaxID=60549 RepID=A0A1N6JGT9_9BURK|nr:helix-turn-helix domain-containing protein [Paraburkholderia phenazinium]SIO43525.1 transcriptional regulator, CdaR family [Paraburkholderia phenazinium]